MKTVVPRLPGGGRSDRRQPPREELAKWLTQPSNPFFSRHLVNLVWERLLGARLVRNLDVWPPKPATTETELLDLLAADFAAHGYDMRRLLQTIALSETYQRACQRGAAQVAGDRQGVNGQIEHWAQGRVRPLSADQIHLSIVQGFGYHYDEGDSRLAEATNDEFTYDLPTDSFGPSAYSLRRSLALYNSEHIRGAVQHAAEVLVRLYGSTVGAEHIERLFLALLCRPPTTQELDAFQELGGKGEARQGLEDVAWVLLNSSEFVTNH
jgi:hypothetical protein